MNCIGSLTIILIYIMTTLPLCMKIKKCQLLVYGTSVPDEINLYSRFKDRLNATSNIAKIEYDARTSEVMNSIYDLAGDILSEQLKQARTEADSQNGNYADKLFDGAHPLDSRDIPSPAVASLNNNAAATTTTTTNTAAYDVEKNRMELINDPVVVSNAEQLGHRQARKIRKASHIFQHSTHPCRLKKKYPGRSVGKGHNSRHHLPLFSLTPMNGVMQKLSPISTAMQERQYATRKTSRNIHDGLQWKRAWNSLDAGAGKKMNGLAESNDSKGDSYVGNDDSSDRSGSSSVKWPRKLQINGRKNNLRECKPQSIFFGEEHFNGDIDSDENLKEMRQQNEKASSYMRKQTRSADSFPEVFSRPLVDSSSSPIIGAANGLNDAIKNANSLLTSVQGLGSNSNTPSMKLDDSSHRIGKQIQRFGEVSLNGPNTAGANLPISDAGTANLTNVMEKVLDELEDIRECKAADGVNPEGSPCDVTGSWNSETIGLQFHISMANPSTSLRTFMEGKSFEIELTERVPPRRHDLMDCDWFLTGSTVKQVGGPFYMTAQKADRFIVATFAGLCKTCGGIPTIFGSWTFVYPSKDCQDISLAIENKRDVLRRDTLEAKRKHRREKLFSKDKGKCSKG